jgi:hypothetical protein
MSLYLDTRHKSSVAIGICDRCARKFPLEDLVADGDQPGLRVCQSFGCWDELDPYKLPARRTEDISLRYPRPEEPLES